MYFKISDLENFMLHNQLHVVLNTRKTVSRKLSVFQECDKEKETKHRREKCHGKNEDSDSAQSLLRRQME